MLLAPAADAGTASHTLAGHHPNPWTQASRLFDEAFVVDAAPMSFGKHIEDLDITATEARRQLISLQAERALALDSGLARVGLYMDDLEEEIAICRELYTLRGVTEIATLRAEMFGAQTG
jgi:hypothetical protein